MQKERLFRNIGCHPHIGRVAEIEASKLRAGCDFDYNELGLKMLDQKWTFDDLKITTVMYEL
jgi:hypothetical protein